MTVGESKPSERRCSGSLPTPPKPEFSNGDVIADRFKITSLIGQGTYGDVYLAIDLKSTLRDHIAIKIDRRNVNNEFLASEARILQDLLRIECVPKFILHGNVSQGSDSRLFLAMKRHGESLSSVRKKFKDGVPIRICSAIFVGMVNALEKFHNAGYIHRDIKPVSF
jgi:serine/threonine protein kinase